jgi:glycosyltransferase involved in cell wall biosynthesis
MPKISCIISTYNRADHFLPKAIDSVLSQTFKDWELVIVDDSSTDDTKKVVNSYQDDRIRYLKTGSNSGSDTKPKNLGTKESKGEYICYLDDDVQYREHAFEILVAELDGNKDLDIVYGDMWIKPREEAGIAFDFDVQFLMLRNYIDTSAAMMRREAMFEIGGWDEKLPKFVDWNVWVRMAKAGLKFKRIEEFTFDYYLHEDAKSQKVKTDMYMHPKLGMLFVPTFSPSGCEIRLPYLSNDDSVFKVAIFTIHYNRLDYSKDTYREMMLTAGYEFDWFCRDNGDDGTLDWLIKDTNAIIDRKDVGKNLGITKSSNNLIELIKDTGEYDIIIKVDNDVEFQTYGWLKDIVDMWKRNHMAYISPYVEGLFHNPGGARRIGFGMIGDEFIEVTNHIGGIFAAIDAKAYDSFRWEDQMLHGNQDAEASMAFRKMGYMPCYYPKHRITHRDGTEGQQQKYKKYFERRKEEKTTKA